MALWICRQNELVRSVRMVQTETGRCVASCHYFCGQFLSVLLNGRWKLKNSTAISSSLVALGKLGQVTAELLTGSHVVLLALRWLSLFLILYYHVMTFQSVASQCFHPLSNNTLLCLSAFVQLGCFLWLPNVRLDPLKISLWKPIGIVGAGLGRLQTACPSRYHTNHLITQVS